MKYLIIDEFNEARQADNILPGDIQAQIDGVLQIFRLVDNRFEEFTPIDLEDTENWTAVDPAVSEEGGKHYAELVTAAPSEEQ